MKNKRESKTEIKRERAREGGIGREGIPTKGGEEIEEVNKNVFVGMKIKERRRGYFLSLKFLVILYF